MLRQVTFRIFVQNNQENNIFNWNANKCQNIPMFIEQDYDLRQNQAFSTSESSLVKFYILSMKTNNRIVISTTVKVQINSLRKKSVC